MAHFAADFTPIYLEHVTIRSPEPNDVVAICTLFEPEVEAGRMLPRDPNKIRAELNTWLAAYDAQGQPVGCVSLVQYNNELCEVRSLAVSSTMRGQGLGSELVKAAIILADSWNMRRVLTLTRAVPFFLKLGFIRDVLANYPEKVWRDCAPCPFKHACDEVALIYHLQPSEDRHEPS